MLMADISASQDFGSHTRSKRESVAELCALLAFSATHNDDKVGLLLFHGETEQYIPPRKGQRHAPSRCSRGSKPWEEVRSTPAPRRRFRDRITSFGRRRLRAARQSTHIHRALQYFLSVHKRKCVVFVVSDFIDQGFESALRSAHRKHDVIAVLITDPRELAIPNIGLVSLEDPETGERRVIDAGSKQFREHVLQSGKARIQELRTRLAASGIDLIHIDASSSVVEPLVHFFRNREKKARR